MKLRKYWLFRKIRRLIYIYFKYW